MKIIIASCIITPWLIFPIVVAQGESSSLSRSTEESEIIGKLSYGKPSSAVKEKQLPDHTVKQSHKIGQGGRTVTVNEVEKPDEVAVVKDKKPVSVAAAEPEAIFRSHVFVTAITYDDQISFVKWRGFKQSEEESLSCWSNVDWTCFEGFNTFKARGQEFTFMILRQGSTLKDLREERRGNNRTDKFRALRQLPNLRAAGARYVMVGDHNKTNERNEQMLEFMEGIHDLYEVKEEELGEALSERKRQVEIQAEERRKNPPKPEDMTLLFWNNDEAPKN